jgi:hypothetical protein
MKTSYNLSVILVGLMAIQSVLGLAFQEQYQDVEWIRATWFGLLGYGVYNYAYYMLGPH